MRLHHTSFLLVLVVCALALGCKSSDSPTTPPNDAVAGAGGASEPGEGDEAGASAMPQGGAGANPGVGEGGDINMPGVGGEPTAPGSWDESFWDKAVWQ
jgi:hypothetical protein